MHEVSPLGWEKHDGLLMSTPYLQTWTGERVQTVMKQMRRQGAHASSTVQTHSGSVIPYALMHYHKHVTF